MYTHMERCPVPLFHQMTGTWFRSCNTGKTVMGGVGLGWVDF